MLDAKLILHNGAGPTEIGTAYSDYEIDFEVADPNFGKGRAIEIIGVATGTLTGGADSQMTISMVHSDSITATDDLGTMSYSSGSNSTISPGTELFRWVLPNEHKRYMRAKFVTADTALEVSSGIAIYLQPRW